MNEVTIIIAPLIHDALLVIGSLIILACTIQPVHASGHLHT